MSVGQGDILLHKSSSGNSEGGSRSGSQILGGVKNNLFGQVEDAERITGGEQIRKWYVTNNHASDTLPAPSVWLSVAPTNCTDLLGLGVEDADDADPDQGNMTAFGANAVVALQSSGSDTRSVTVTGITSASTPAQETLALDGTNEVTTATTWSKVYGVAVGDPDGARTVTVKQGAAGTTRGTIAAGRICCWLWVEALTEGGALVLPDLLAQQSWPIWEWLAWDANVSGVIPDNAQLSIKGA
jgi:hypothetical protein